MSQLQASLLFRKITALAAAGAREDVAGISVEDWPAVVHMAMGQKVLPLVGAALLDGSGTDCPEELRNQILNYTRSVASGNRIRQQRIMALIRDMEQSGIQVQLIKGYALDHCYSVPECRQSEDTDLLISREQEEKACAVLREWGFRVDRRSPTSHHAVCQHPKLGMVELHVQLYDEMIQEGWLKKICPDALPREPFVRIQTPAGECASLGYSDHGVFLAVHMVKHFIGTGLNLRMMLDLALFLSAHREEIDFGRFWNVLQKLQFAGIVNCVLHIMVESGGFSWEDFPGATKPELRKVDAFLADMLQRMYTGAGEDNAYYEYSKCVMRRNMKPLEYKGYMLSWTVRNTLAQMWPDKEQLFAMYRVEKPIAWMVPVLRLRRIIDLPLEKIRSGITPGRLLARGKDAPNLRNRMELFKFLDML